MPGRWTVTPGGDECALWSPETTVKAHCGLDKSFNMHTLLPADQMHSGSVGGPGGALSGLMCPARCESRKKGSTWAVRSESFRSLQDAALRGNAPVHWITESAHELHHDAKEEHSLPFSNTQYSTWLEKVAPGFLSLCSTRKSQCVLWSVPGERQLNFLRE